MNFTVYKSSAGSGKTYTLVREYLQLALASPEPDYFRHILAITFTNKAANEMKERVLTKLELFSHGNSAAEDSMFRELKKNLALDDFTLAERARKLLSLILHNYSYFNISTIDKFTHRVLSTFAHDMRLPVSFNVEVEADELLNEAVDILLQKAGNDEILTKTLVEFAESRADDEGDWRIERSIFQLSKNLLFDEEGHFHVEALKNIPPEGFDLIRKNISAFCENYENRLRQIANKALKTIAGKEISIDDLYYGKSGIGGYFSKINQGRFDDLNGKTYVQKTLGEGIWYSKKATVETQNKIDEIVPVLIDAYNQIQFEKEANHSNYILYLETAKNLYALSVLNEVEKIMNELKTQNNTVHISEFNRLVSGVVMFEPAPFIYERIGQRFHHYLIDEFQDTSVLQWLNLLPLLDESLAKTHFSMVVGDAKQAIYRWRGGRVEQFVNLPKIFLTPALEKKKTAEREEDEEKAFLFRTLVEQRQATLVRTIGEKKLNANYRSKTEIVEFNNDFFGFLASQLDDDYKNIYESLKQQSDEKNTGGSVSIDFVEKDGYDERVLEQTKKTVEQLLNDGFQLKDIAVLARKNEQASKVAKFLLENNINVISSESLLLSQSAEVNFLVSLLQYLYNNRDVIAEAQALHFLAGETSRKENSLEKYFSENHPAVHFKSLLKHPLYEIFEKLIGEFFHASPDPYIQFFLDAVHVYVSRRGNDTGAFLQWWEEKKNKISIVVPQGINAINVLTIHKSKGLEFPVVIYPFAQDKVTLRFAKLWLDVKNKKELAPMQTALTSCNKALEETEYRKDYIEEKNKTTLDFLNLLYVAFTRPVNRLCIITPYPEKEKDTLAAIPQSLKAWLEHKEKWSDEKFSYFIGKNEKYISKNESDENAYRLEKFISSDWRDKLMISRHPNFHANRAGWDVGRDLQSRPAKKEHQTEWGNFLHNILSQIYTVNDVASVLASMKAKGELTEEDEIHLAQFLNELLNRSDVKPYFAEGLNVKTEAEILLNDGRRLRPDRIVIEGKKASVIDFKTGKAMPEHEEQLEKYAKTLMRMGFEKVEKKLVYFN